MLQGSDLIIQAKDQAILIFQYLELTINFLHNFGQVMANPGL